MSAPTPVISNVFESSASDRLATFITEQGISNKEVIPLTPDASTRQYYRIRWQKRTAVAAVYPEPFDPEFHPYLDVTRLFLDCDLPVPEIYAVDGNAGIIVQEDLGDRQLFHIYDDEQEEQCEEYKEKAIALIAKIQNATDRAYETHSIASRLAFDEAKLSWELDFFFDHYFGSLRGETLRHAEVAELKAELNDIAAGLAAVPRVLCHRDYHASNLMIDNKKQLRIVDHQDARMGPASYDLVSFLLDRQPCPPSLADLRGHRLFFLEQRRLLGLSAIDPDDFALEFRLMTIQRGLKATGTFSYQTAVCGRGTVYQHFIQPTLEIVLQAAEWLERFPTLRRILKERIN
ncbi:MAG TPA: phosphotransferase [Pyrinomonadaceae bacterium]|nr:phosphotransferase [Pyrinomonadaceae bacterium]